jgi:hypothetical protein
MFPPERVTGLRFLTQSRTCTEGERASLEQHPVELSVDELPGQDRASFSESRSPVRRVC